MEREERLEQLRAREKELHKNWVNMKINVGKEFYRIIDMLSYDEGSSKLLRPKEEEDYEARIERGDYGDETIKWKVSINLYFQDIDGTRASYGDLSVKITNKKLFVNLESMNGYINNSDAPQLSKIILAQNLLLTQDLIINRLNRVVDLSEVEERYQVTKEINQIEQEIRKEKENAAKEAAMIQLKNSVGKYIASIGTRWINHHKPNGDIDFDKPSYKKPFYCDFMKIVKITEANVIYHEVENNGFVHAWVDRRYPIRQAIFDLTHNYKYIISSMDEEPKGGEEDER